jgi:peptidoglycan/xylan/chitin deacetylase (PgdA/CDA1 family)
MLAVLMYHRVFETKFASKPEAFFSHLKHLAKHYPIVLPGEKLEKNRINLCLTFDDAYYDFYYHVFPLLKELNIRAVLAIPAGLILESTDLSDEQRLTVPYKEALRSAHTHATLCSWQEIRYMVNSKLVVPAAHGLTHQNLLRTSDLKNEVVNAKLLLQEKTNYEVSTFIYPYGSMTRSMNRFVHQQYLYTMRIGSALNFNWQNLHQVIYRINMEEFWPEQKPCFTLPHQLSLLTRFFSNTLRFK